jgi:hypothetical protein
MPGLNRKVRITTDWLLRLLFPPELAQTRLAFESGIPHPSLRANWGRLLSCFE